MSLTLASIVAFGMPLFLLLSTGSDDGRWLIVAAGLSVAAALLALMQMT